MCKFKETTLGIKKLDFGVKRGAMAVFLTEGLYDNGRPVFLI